MRQSVALTLVTILAVFASTGLGVAAGRASSSPPTAQKAKAKPAWEWTDEERLAARYDPANLQARRGAYQKKMGAKATPEYDSIEGKKNPELLQRSDILSSHERTRRIIRESLS